MAQDTAGLIQRILGPEYLALEAMHYRVSEYVGPGLGCHIILTLRHVDDPDRRAVIEARGVGVVDAIFHGLVRHFSRTFESLATLAFTSFTVSGQMDGADGAGLASAAEVSLVVTNGHGGRRSFTATGRSTLAATIAVVLAIVEHYVNAERAFVTMHRALVDAQGRRRPDLVEEFTAQLAMLVHNTSYTEVSERIRGAG